MFNMAQTQNEKDTLLCTYEDCKEIQIEDSEFCKEHNTLTDNELYILQEKEKIPKSILKSLDPNYKDRFSFKVLENRDFWFSLGYGNDNKLSLSGNCYAWSNAFQFINPSKNLVYKLLNLHNKISKRALNRIMSELKGNVNILFFCKEDYRFKQNKEDLGFNHKDLTWHFFPTEDHNISKKILYTDSIKDFKTLNEFERTII